MSMRIWLGLIGMVLFPVGVVGMIFCIELMGYEIWKMLRE